MMNVVFLSPHFPPTFYLFCQALSRNGITVLGIGEEDGACLRPELREALADYARVDSLDDYDQVMRSMAGLIHRHGRMHRVVSHNEHWLILEARLRDDFNVPGLTEAATWNLKRKSWMKEIFRRHAIPIVEGMVLPPDKGRADLEHFADQHGWPLFAKPDIGVGAACTFKIDGPEQIDHFLATRPSENYFIEPFIDGDLVTFDGLVDQNGTIVFSSSLFSAIAAYDLVAFNRDLSYYLVREIPADIIELGKKAVDGFGLRESFFHLEFLRRHADDRLFALELNCRPPGGFTPDLMNFAADIDVYQEWANLVAFNRFSSPIDRRFFAAHISRKDGKAYRHSHEEIVARYGDRIPMAVEVAPIFAEVMGNFAYLARAPEKSQIEEMVRFIQEQA
jgi:hypothetical protein